MKLETDPSCFHRKADRQSALYEVSCGFAIFLLLKLNLHSPISSINPPEKDKLLSIIAQLQVETSKKRKIDFQNEVRSESEAQSANFSAFVFLRASKTFNL
jgi:hypothetical protein